MKKIYSLLFLMLSFNLMAKDKVEVINTKNVTTSEVEVHAKIVPIFNVTQTESLKFNKILSGTSVEQDQIITITDEYNAPIQLIFPTEAKIKTNNNKTIAIKLSSPEKMTKFINTNGSRDIIVRGTIANKNIEDGIYEGTTTFKVKYN